ncbi:hypothetical protein VE01_09643 [Pseudogymnoascus verrucosus]|uniref:Major facilitator superfamily (MFS) profile domain-containing protein n=1 Tax=Pseudogymnoascus verrucosus TaxID=342668 RepID=A0A1B8G9S5_9PEZI|nr:uncharacterized protein VE01_09643 [Pseudogymnoascus verrucosus]OBT92571.1 hypothetical protein VE01_09643 [Pseudogymnoascus verrucosus]
MKTQQHGSTDDGDCEKAMHTGDEDAVKSPTTADVESARNAALVALSPTEKRKVIRRVDLRVTCVLGLIYCISQMDRNNLGFAAIAGMNADLGMDGTKYSIVILVMFITYVAFQPVATVLMRIIGPRYFLSAITVSWGAVVIGFGFSTKWWELIPLRLVLGALEAGVFPGSVYLLSCWYPRYDLQKRTALFYLIGTIASAFTGILAYGLSQMEGLGSGAGLGTHFGPTEANPNAPAGIMSMSGIAGWRWIFIMLGVITVVCGLISLFFIVDFPENASKKSFGMTFLNEKEVAFFVARIEEDRLDVVAEEFNLRAYLKNAADLKLWAFASLFGLTTTTNYAVAYFLPIILRNSMGFSIAQAQCLTAPPFVAAGITMITLGWISDKYRIRGPIVLLNATVSIIGLCILGFAKGTAVRYFSVFLIASTGNSNTPGIVTWQSNNVRGQWKRAFGSAAVVAFGGLGGIIGGTVFRTEDAPLYRPGIYACLIANFLIVAISLILMLTLHRANKRADAGQKVIQGLVGFRYAV